MVWNIVVVLVLVIFLLVVVPIWLLLHYIGGRQIASGLNKEEIKQLNNLVDKTMQMSTRIESLEAILDAETPKWRDKHDVI